MKIPRIIHQTWKTTEIPTQIFPPQWSESWKIYHPQWEYKFWTDFSGREFINELYPWFLPLYDNFHEQIYRVDVLRYFLMYHFGGVYVDLDFECFQNVEPLLQNHSIVLGRMSLKRSDRHAIPNAFLASEKLNPFWLILIQEIIRRRASEFVEYITGPVVLRDVINTLVSKSHSQSNSTFLICAPQRLYPINWRDKSIACRNLEYERDSPQYKNSDGTYAATYWTKSWQKQAPTRLGIIKAHFKSCLLKLLTITLERERLNALKTIKSEILTHHKKDRCNWNFIFEDCNPHS